MGRPFPVLVRKIGKLSFIGTELLFITVALAALIDRTFSMGWGFSWSTFFVAFVASAWGAVAYPLCGGCWGWDKA